MNKQNKIKLLISSIIILLPCVFGILVYDSLPNELITHYNAQGIADGTSSRFSAIFALPIILLIIHNICIYFTFKDNINTKQNAKMMNIIFWIIPILSLVTNYSIYATALGISINIATITRLLIALMFLVIGNYLPKCTPNHTIGIRVKWTLINKDNWNKTHRLAGKLWVSLGIILLATIFIPIYKIQFLYLIGILISIIIPVLYSYNYAKIHPEVTDSTYLTINKKYNVIFTIVLIIFIAGVLFLGKFNITCNDTYIDINARFWNDSTITYENIKDIEYRTQDTPGSRTYGYGTPFILMGQFQNEEFNTYIRYTYPSCKDNIVIKVDDTTIVINLKDSTSTKALYDEILKHIS